MDRMKKNKGFSLFSFFSFSLSLFPFFLSLSHTKKRGFFTLKKAHLFKHRLHLCILLGGDSLVTSIFDDLLQVWLFASKNLLQKSNRSFKLGYAMICREIVKE